MIIQPTLSLRTLVHLARLRGRTTDVAAVAEALGAPRSDVRAAVTRLYERGLVDPLRLRPTLEGLAVAASAAGARTRAARDDRSRGAERTPAACVA